MTQEQPSIPQLIATLVACEEGGRETLALRLGSSASALSRWASGSSKPRPSVEGKIRSLASKWMPAGHGEEPPSLLFEMPDVPEENRIRQALGQTFRQVREILHRSGRLSSRHEALEELSKLVFAHVMSIDTGGHGISAELLSAEMPAAALRDFVASAHHLHLPSSLSHELRSEDFQLRIKDTEDRFACEIVDCFMRLAPPEVLAQVRGAGSMDLLNDAFGQFLSTSFSDEKELGQYLTPTEVVQFMVRLGLSSLDGETLDAMCDPARCATAGLIIDPSCGVGSFLAETLRVLYAKVRSTRGEQALPAWANAMLGSSVVGIDKSERMVKLALTNLALFGAPAVNLHLANSLVRTGKDAAVTASLTGKAKLILTNPPFGAEFDLAGLGDYRIATEWAQRSSKTIPSELLFMERYIEWLAPGGSLLAIVPDSVLTNRGYFEDLRNGIAERVQLRSVISLPSVTFAGAGTQTKTSILHLKKLPEPSKAASEVYYAICRNVGYEVTTRGANRRKVFDGNSDLGRILREACGESVPAFGRIVTVSARASRWDAGYQAGLSSAVHRKLQEAGRDNVVVATVASLVTARENPERRGEAEFDYIEIGDVDGQSCQVGAKRIASCEAPSRARKPVRAGDVLVSTVRPERRTIGVVPPDLDGAICSTGFAVLRCKTIEPLVLARLLQSDFVNEQLLRNNIGIAYPAIDEACILETVLPLSGEDLQTLRGVTRDLEAARAQVAVLEGQFTDKLADLTERWLRE